MLERAERQVFRRSPNRPIADPNSQAAAGTGTVTAAELIRHLTPIAAVIEFLERRLNWTRGRPGEPRPPV